MHKRFVAGLWTGLTALLATGFAGAQGAYVTCESVDYGNTECRVDGGPVMLARQLSAVDCVEGRSWGFDASRRMIWVSNGCRAEFRVGGGQGAGGSSIILYEHDNFGGRSYSTSGSVSNLNDSGFNDRASSIIVLGGRWQICETIRERRAASPCSLAACGSDRLGGLRGLGMAGPREDPGGGYSSRSSTDLSGADLALRLDACPRLSIGKGA
jgi:hypothetical protein